MEEAIKGEESQEISEITDKNQKPWLFKKGQSGNPAGRPKGRFSITTQIINRLEENPEQLDEIVNWLIKNRKDLVWNKIDPNPPTDIKLDGEIAHIMYLPTELLPKNDIPQLTSDNR